MKVSVALCTYNGAKYIDQQLRSILDQTVSVDEIVISDDGSTDDTLKIAEEILRNSGIAYRIVNNKLPKGVAHNFLNALKLTTGEYCFTCDQDDIWCADKVACFIDCAQKTGKDLYFSDGMLAGPEGEPLGCTLWEAYGISETAMGEDTFVATLIKRPVVTGAAMMISRKLIDDVNYVPSGVLHDEWFSMLAAARDSMQPIPKQTFLYRQHGNNVVGARKWSFLEKIGIWYRNLQKIEDVRKKAYDRICALVAATEGTQYQVLTAEAHAFWQILDGLPQKSRFLQLGIITKLFFQKKYTRFYTGLRGYVRDVMVAAFVRR